MGSLGAVTGACLGAGVGFHGLSGLEGVTIAEFGLPGGPGMMAVGLGALGMFISCVEGCGCLCGSGSRVTSSGLPFAATPKSASSKRSPIIVSDTKTWKSYFYILPNSPSPSSVLVSFAFSGLATPTGRGGRSSSSWGEGLGGASSFLIGA